MKIIKVLNWVLLIFLISVSISFALETITIHFNSNNDLKGFVSAQTGDRGKLAEWKIILDNTAPSGNKVLLVIPNPKTNRGSVFNTFISKKEKLKNMDISVMLKAVKGREDQGGGLIWRAKDKNNYYVVRWNPLEDNFRLYYVKNSTRHMLKSVSFYAEPKRWHKIRVIQKGDSIGCYFDAKKKIQYSSHIIKDAGYVGLWTKADASTEFDDFTIKIIKK